MPILREDFKEERLWNYWPQLGLGMLCERR